MNALLESALAMAAAGWAVIPLHTPVDGACDCRRPNCTSPGKHPRTKNGLSDATTNADQISNWWNRWPDANIGAVVPSDLVVVDVDVPDLATVFSDGELPSTPTSKTGRGWHLIYRTATPIRPKVGVRAHVDLRGPGSYIVVPPSLHVSGMRYEWVVPLEDGIAEAPAWIAEAARSPRMAGGRSDDADNNIPEGQRNASLTSLAGAMRRRSMTATEIEAALLAVNVGRCEPPLPEDAVRRIASSVGRYPPGIERATPRRPANEAIDDGDPAACDYLDGGLESESADLGPTEPAEGGKRSQATQLVELVEGVELFHAPDGSAYARIEQGDHREVWPLKSSAIRSWLAGTYYRRHGRAAGGQAIRDAVEVLAARALFDGPECAVHVRVARTRDAIYLDLADPKWRAVKITASGWEIVTDSPAHFRRPDGLLGLPDPVRGGSLEELRPFLNVADDTQWRLAVGWLVAAVRGAGPYAVLDLQGEHGSAKSSTARAQRRVIDPNASPDRAAPRHEHDLAIAAQNSLVVSLDNISRLPDWLSDALARLATGAGFAARMLYTDGEEKLFYGARPIIINAIGDVVTKSDLLDRSIVLELPRVADQSRRTEEELWAEFDTAHPRILGALLDAVAGALARRPSTRLERPPRMADFATWVVAAEPALGWPPGGFLRAYAGNRASAHELALEASSVGPPVRVLLSSGDWQGTPTELLGQLTSIAGDNVTRRKDWPADPRALSQELARLAPNLRAVGIGFERKSTGKQRLVFLTSLQSSVSSVSSVVPVRGTPDADGPALTETVVASRSSVSGLPVQTDAADAPDAELRAPSNGALAGWGCSIGPGHVSAIRADGSVYCATCHPPYQQLTLA
jgi:hypothetical protein